MIGKSTISSKVSAAQAVTDILSVFAAWFHEYLKKFSVSME